jgi:mannan endo-1,4-beta-mannosidase
MNRRLLFASLILTVTFPACRSFFPWGEPDDFIKVRGTHFIHNDKPYYFLGANLWYGCYIGSPGSTGERERLLRELDSLRANGLTNLRILAGSEQSYLTRSVRPAIQRSPGNLNDSLLQGMDYLLAEMAKRKMHAVLYLNNYWEWSGGMSQYNAWADGGKGVDPEDPSQGYSAFMEYSASFYRNEKATAMFRDYIRRIVARENTCNGRLYSDDPTIMSWQLANEPRPGTNGPAGEENLSAYYGWIQQTSAYIHSLDTNHLVSTGIEGAVGFRWSIEFFLRTHESPHVDYCTFHLWPKNWEWFDPMDIAGTLPSTVEYINGHVATARQLGKPVVLEEFGLARDSARCAPGTSTAARDRYFEKILTVLDDSAKAGAPIAGSNVWAWGGYGKGKNADDMWRIGDPFVGDPPQEPQGYNSVYITDSSTLRILRNHAFTMMAMVPMDSLTPERAR